MNKRSLKKERKSGRETEKFVGFLSYRKRIVNEIKLEIEERKRDVLKKQQLLHANSQTDLRQKMDEGGKGEKRERGRERSKD